VNEAALTRLQRGGLAERRTDPRGAETLALTDRGRRLGDAVTAELLA
jgi:DNA-binding MarR family transcriptional regulator